MKEKVKLFFNCIILNFLLFRELKSKQGLSQSFKGPCVIFSGHPTLELGECRKWAQDWCKNKSSRNKIIVTEPGLPENIFNDSERNRVVNYLPIDTR